MAANNAEKTNMRFPRPVNWPLPAKALVTMIVVMMSLGLLFAGGQVAVHDIMPTFFSGSPAMSPGPAQMEEPVSDRGDLFGGTMPAIEKLPFYKSDEFIFALDAYFILMQMWGRA